MRPRPWLLLGIPRSGNALCCRLAAGLPDTVALSQPLNSHYSFGEKCFGPLPRDVRSACTRVGEFAGEVREQILAEGIAPSHQVGGGLYDNIMAPKRAEIGLRERQGRWGVITIDKPLSDRFTLLISQPAVFSALLPHLTAGFPCLAIVRDPLALLASWQTVNLPFRQGRIAGAEPFDPELRRRLDDEPVALHRQLLILEWFFGRFVAHMEPRHVIRYEDLIESGGSLLFRALGHERARAVALQSRNDSALYDGDEIESLLQALLERGGGSWRRFYRDSDLERTADGILRRGR